MGKINKFDVNFSSMRMGRDVLKKVGEILTTHRKMKPEEGEKLIKDLEVQKRIIKEVWG